jgi:hypothetical protein
MAISKIMIVDDISGKTETLPTKFAIKGQNVYTNNTVKGLGVSYAGNSIVALNSYSGAGIFDEAVNELTDMSYVTSINNVSPSKTGAFFLLGSECTSISSSLEIEEGDSEDTDGTISVVDLCTSCTKCGNYLNSLKQLEAYKILLNKIKDYNLYKKDIAAIREDFLNSKRLQLTSVCEEELANNNIDEDKLLSMALSSDILFKQYIATIHMWNYAVSMAGAHTQITTAPEDPSGFVIQTLRAIPSCSGELSVSVDIKVTGPETCNDGDVVSIYVPNPAVELLPTSKDSSVVTPNAEIEHISVNEKAIHIPTTVIESARSLCITARFLPFVAIKLMYGDTEISVDNFISNIITQDKEDVEDDEEVWELTIDKLLNGIKLTIEGGYWNGQIDDIDGEVGDIIFQMSLFGEIVYG